MTEAFLSNSTHLLLKSGDLATMTLFVGTLTLFGLVEAWSRRGRPPADRWPRWPVNFTLAFFWIATGLFLPISSLALSIWVHNSQIGLSYWLDAGPLATLIAGLLARSLMSYATHVLMHKLPWFWRVHRVHHLDTALDISTTARFHPLEAVLAAPLAWVGIILFGISPLAFLFYELIDAAIVVFSHANIRLPPILDRILRILIVTPAMHRVHHSSYQPETDSNYGATLSVWDRLFGTYRNPDRSIGHEHPLGLAEVQDDRTCSLFWLLASPLLPKADFRARKG